MLLKLETYYALPCVTKVFKINGIDADVDDFGDNTDEDRDNAPDYGCGCHKFTADPNKAEKAMKKYNITLDEFKEVCDKLTEMLYVGVCGWCS